MKLGGFAAVRVGFEIEGGLRVPIEDFCGARVKEFCAIVMSVQLGRD